MTHDRTCESRTEPGRWPGTPHLFLRPTIMTRPWRTRRSLGGVGWRIMSPDQLRCCTRRSANIGMQPEIRDRLPREIGLLKREFAVLKEEVGVVRELEALREEVATARADYAEGARPCSRPQGSASRYAEGNGAPAARAGSGEGQDQQINAEASQTRYGLSEMEKRPQPTTIDRATLEMWKACIERWLRSRGAC